MADEHQYAVVSYGNTRSHYEGIVRDIPSAIVTEVRAEAFARATRLNEVDGPNTWIVIERTISPWTQAFDEVIPFVGRMTVQHPDDQQRLT